MAELMMHRFSIGAMKFIRRPVSEAAEEGQMGIVDNGDGRGWTDRCPAQFLDGKWVSFGGNALRFEPTHWIVMEGMDRRGEG